MTARWILPALTTDNENAGALARVLGCSPGLAQLLQRRGITSPAQAEAFLNPRLKTLSDPFLLPDIRPVVDRIFEAIDGGERIVLYGDYDVDGITSIALLTRLLRAYGAQPQYFLPDRIEEGYGITVDGLARCLAECRPRLLIALDCGTSSAAELATLTPARENPEGVDVIVVDHHECHDALPRCVAVVNPKRADAGAGAEFRYLCTAGLVFKLCHALLKTRQAGTFALRDYLDLVALGTVADIVPLIAENRIVVQKGLETMANTQSTGLRALIEVAAVKTPIDSTALGFQLGPRLNAAGRLGTARDSLDLLLTDDPSRARSLATSLDMQNRDRQAVEKKTLLEAERQIEDHVGAHAAIICGGSGWHPGVLGIVASRLCRTHHRPALVIGFDENGVGKGSGRSVAGFSLVEALGRCGNLLERFGGHEMAAGLTVRQERFEEFTEAFRQVALESLPTEPLPVIHLDAELQFEELGLDFLAAHERLQPFGMGNPHPIFLTRGVHPFAEPVVLKEKHLRLTLVCNSVRHQAIFFNGIAEPLPRPPWDIAFKIARNEWRGQVSVSIQIQGIRTAEQA